MSIRGPYLEVNSRSFIWDYIHDHMKKHGEKVAQMDAETGDKLTFNDIVNMSKRLSRVLIITSGIHADDTIAICSENNINYCWILLGALATGASCILLNPAYTPRELEHALGISQPKVVLCSASVGKINAQGQAPSIDVFDNMECITEIIVWGCKNESIPQTCKKLEDIFSFYNKLLEHEHSHAMTMTTENGLKENLKEKPYNELDNIALILSSSGSTGLPKGVMLTQANIVAALTTSGNYINQEEIALGLLPFFHAFGLLLMLMSLCEGAEVVVMRKFAVDAFINTIKKYKITSLYLVPSLLVLISKKHLITDDVFSSIHHIWTGAAPVNPNIQKKVYEKLKGHGCLHHSYGLTETTFTMFTDVYRSDKPGSPGRITPGMECKVIDQHTKQILGPNQSGELCFRGPLVMAGYMKNPDATSETIDSERWIHSGDLGYYDNDHYFFIVDRLKEMMKYQGHQVSPSELEALLLTHTAIQDAAVAGVPDDLYGELPRAFIVKTPGVHILEKAIIDFVANKVAPHKRLHGGVKFVDSIPKTVSGKIQRRELRKFDAI